MIRSLYALCFLALVANPKLAASVVSPTPTEPGKLVRLNRQAPGTSGGWTYTKTIDPAGTPVYKASIRSPTTLEFSYPYAGGSIATLTIRKRASTTHVFVEVSKGQFNRSFQGGNARIRFDNQAVRQYAVSAAANGRANILFLDADGQLIHQMKRAKRMNLEVAFAGQGNRQMEFRTAGLIWNH